MIREAEDRDIDKILDMAHEFWGHTAYPEEFDREHTKTMVELSINQKLTAVLELEGEVQGFVAGIMSHLMGSRKAMIGTELAWWINPDYRKGLHGIDLMVFIEDMARNAGVKYWNMIAMESSAPEVAKKIYSRAGYQVVETTYSKRLI